jgi:hypothetical protein
MFRLSRLVLTIIASNLIVGLASGQDSKHFFYHGYPYGSESLFNPVSVFANGGFDAFQIINDRQPTWENVYWQSAGSNVWKSVTSPLLVINRFGWNKFLSQEVFPMSLNMENAQYAPNFFLHALGGGMVYRKLSEWYDQQGFPAPFVWGAATRFVYEYVNETVENGPGNDFYNEDCLPDMLIFQPLGILLFSFDGVSEFFSSTLNLNDWSQPVGLSFAPFAIRNAGQNFVMKLALNQNKNTSLFFHFGDFAILGLSFKTNPEDAISFGAGLASNGRRSLPKQNDVPYNTVTVGPMAGLYFDRNNSLMASLVYADVPNHRFRLNVYPGLLSNNYWSPGFFVSVAQDGATIVGLTARFLPVGLSLHMPR